MLNDLPGMIILENNADKNARIHNFRRKWVLAGFGVHCRFSRSACNRSIVNESVSEHLLNTTIVGNLQLEHEAKPFCV